MLKICTIGIGNAGNQISELAFTEKNIAGFAINSSKGDLDCVSSIPTLLIGDEKGAGKDRDSAKVFIKARIKDLLMGKDNVKTQNPLVEHINQHDVIFIISSIGGGTGSGMAPMFTDILSRAFSEKKFILVEVYPPLGESIGAQQNGIEYIREVRDNLPNVTYMCYDNHRKSSLPSTDMMLTVNREIVEHLSIIRGDYLFNTPFNSIDEKDMMRIIDTPNRLCVYIMDNLKEKDLDDRTMEEYLIDQIKTQSANVELDRDKIIKRLGVIVNLNEGMNSQFNSNTPEVKGFAGEPVESFEHIYLSKDKGEKNRIILIMSGLSLPGDRLVKIQQRIEEGLEALKRTSDSSVLDEIDVDSIKGIRKDQGQNKDLDLDELFDKY